MLLEMHCHTSEYSSCSHVKAVDLVRRAWERGLQGIVLTDHHHYWQPDELARLRRRAALPDHFLLLSGQEVTTFDVGDVLVYGVEVSIRLATPLPVIRARFPEAAIVWAHPFRYRQFPTPEQLTNPLLDAVEVLNCNQSREENSRGLIAWRRLRFVATGGTDTHAVRTTGTFPTRFEQPIANVQELAAELRCGRCRPFHAKKGRSISKTGLIR